ncbi:hypothetical protein AVEN_210922-1 [Araneus ventricosus]|uniref:Uncharacterized protein n=1 Tax=Araneus ventricosus TaxID=182803 RepID=A0A4Y2PVY9_ARAVE|nr:hypothetical protein AVEN_210922-1 [Araneus ventricosus]
MIDFTPARRASFNRVSRPDVFGEEGGFLSIQTMTAVIAVFQRESEFPLSLIEELGRSRLLRSLYFNRLRNQRVNIRYNTGIKTAMEVKDMQMNAYPSLLPPHRPRK